jgi:signal transduction histidine kinase
MALWLIALLWGSACLAAPSQIVEQAFVVDPSGQMTLEQAQQQAEQPYTGSLARLLEHSVVWVRLRVAPSISAGGATTERLRLVPAWSLSLSLYDPLQRDANGRIARLDSPPTTSLFSVQMHAIPVVADARDLWLRLDSGGSVYLKASVLTQEVAEARALSDAVLQGVVIGAQALLILVGLIAWMADRSGIGHTMFTKQVVNLMMALLNANLFLLPKLPDMPQWPEGVGAYGLEGLRVLNMAVSLWFFMKVLELMQAPRWILRVQRVPLALMALCVLLLAGGQLALVTMIELVLYLAVPLGLMVGSMACRRKLLQPLTVLGLAHWMAQGVGFGLVLAAAWVASFSSGFYKTQEVTFFGILTPIAAICAVGVLLLLSWQRLRAERAQQVVQHHQAELNALALDFERGERRRQQEFMGMLTHELKAPLSTLGMVIGSAAPSASMHHHAALALASMRQVVDHCAQSAEIEDSTTPPNQVMCSLALALELRNDAHSETTRIQMAPTEAMPSLLADPRMLAVIFNNLLDNALMYSPQGSQVNTAIVRESNPEGAVQRVSVTNQVTAGSLPDPALVFSKYYRGDAVQRRSGSGLGLHLSRLLARRQGGDLLYQTHERGVTFTLVLPETQAVAAA